MSAREVFELGNRVRILIKLHDKLIQQEYFNRRLEKRYLDELTTLKLKCDAALRLFREKIREK